MSALKFFSDKPRSSVSEWVEILTKNNYKEESYDGIPELVDAIDLQATSGMTEASRALRKKLKHGNPHQQYRALVILKALVDNCGEKFRKVFQDANLTDALRNLVGDSETDRRVKKKLLLVLSAWDEQYKDDPNMQFVAGILKYYGGSLGRRSGSGARAAASTSATAGDELTRAGLVERHSNEGEARKKKDVLKELNKSERSQDKKKDKRKLQRPQRELFDFERDKEKVMQSIVEGFQSSSNLANAITLVNPQTDSIFTNQRVQESLEQAKKVKSKVVRYIRLVENEDIIGTLIETNEKLITAIEMYESLVTPNVDPESVEIAKALANVDLTRSADDNDSSPFDDDDDNDNDNNNTPGTRNIPSSPPVHIHPDLEDLTFGSLNKGGGGKSSTGKLPEPLKPSFPGSANKKDDNDPRGKEDRENRGSLSDFSDYESSSDGERTSRKGFSRNYVTVSDNGDEGEEEKKRYQKTKIVADDGDDDPFADPFADGQSLKR